MSGKTLTNEELLAMLAAAPGRIAEVTASAMPVLLRSQPGPDEWSANEVLAHLRACDDIWGGCIKSILVEDNPTLRAVNPRTWIEKTNYRKLEFALSLQAFTAQRAELLVALRPLRPEDWLRAATVTVAGKPHERTVRFYAEWLATHERPHVRQIERIARV